MESTPEEKLSYKFCDEAGTLKYWILFPFKNGKLIPAQCDQFTQCSDSLTLSLTSVTSTNDVCIIRITNQKNGSHTVTCIHNIHLFL